MRAYCLTLLAYNTKFGPAAQTPTQRAWVLEQLQAIILRLKTKVTAAAQQVYDCYVARKLSWPEVHQGLDTAPR